MVVGVENLLIIVLFRVKKENLNDLSDEEWIELLILEKELERVCKKLFNSTMFNFCYLMNNAYRDNRKSHVHYHFVPRYSNPLFLFDKKYVDKHFGYNFWKWSLSKLKKKIFLPKMKKTNI